MTYKIKSHWIMNQTISENIYEGNVHDNVCILFYAYTFITVVVMEERVPKIFLLT